MTVKPESPNTPSLPRTARPIQPTLVVYWPKLEFGSESSDSVDSFEQALARLDATSKTGKTSTIEAWRKLSEPFGGTRGLAPRRAFNDSALLDALITRAVAQAEKNPEAFEKSTGLRGYRGMDYKHYFQMSIPRAHTSPSVMDSYCALKSGLKGLGAQVYLSMPTRHAQALNSYVGPAQASGVAGACGVGASSLKSGSGNPITGAGEFIVDIEKAWLMAGLNATTPAASLPSRVNAVESAQLADIDHGAAVAGIILGTAIDPTTTTATSIVGLAPNATFVKGPCLEATQMGDPSQTLTAAILDAVVYLSGLKDPDGVTSVTGVILIEQETWDGLPIESSPLEFAAIQTAVAAGHIVVQPAGNGNQNLDAVSGWWFDGTTQPDGTPTLAARSLDPSQGGPISGAITVAAACSGQDPATGVLGDRSAMSNYGNLIDGWAWGDSIATVTVTKDEWGNFVNFPSLAGFGGTSGAAAIISGVILLLQQMRVVAGQQRLKAGELRTLLQNPKLGTQGQGDLAAAAQPPRAAKFMPDLVALKNFLGL